MLAFDRDYNLVNFAKKSTLNAIRDYGVGVGGGATAGALGGLALAKSKKSKAMRDARSANSKGTINKILNTLDKGRLERLAKEAGSKVKTGKYVAGGALIGGGVGAAGTKMFRDAKEIKKLTDKYNRRGELIKDLNAEARELNYELGTTKKKLQGATEHLKNWDRRGSVRQPKKVRGSKANEPVIGKIAKMQQDKTGYPDARIRDIDEEDRLQEFRDRLMSQPQLFSYLRRHI